MLVVMVTMDSVVVRGPSIVISAVIWIAPVIVVIAVWVIPIIPRVDSN